MGDWIYSYLVTVVESEFSNGMFAAIKFSIFEEQVILLPFNFAVLPSQELEGSHIIANTLNWHVTSLQMKMILMLQKKHMYVFKNAIYFYCHIILQYSVCLKL